MASSEERRRVARGLSGIVDEEPLSAWDEVYAVLFGSHRNPVYIDSYDMIDISIRTLAGIIDPGDDVSVSAYDLLAKEDRDALRWVREHGGIDQVRLHHDLGDGLSDLVDRVAERLGVGVGGLDAQDAEPVLMGAIDRRIMPNGFSWPTGADGEDILPGQVVYANGMPTGDGQEWTVVSVSFGDDHPIHCRDRGGRKRDLKPGWVTHRRAESWELIASEARMLPQDYVRERGLACGSQYDDARRRMCDDLVRRARALAGRGES